MSTKYKNKKIDILLSEKFCYIFAAEIVLCSDRKSLHHVIFLESEVEVWRDILHDRLSASRNTTLFITMARSVLGNVKSSVT